MLHILIVDDEVHAVRGLQAGVNWDLFGPHTVHTAYNVTQAMACFEAARIDLLLCDIEMPHGSGLDLLLWVREHHPQVETIFLTCHADFKYAKQALQLSSFDYMLKPVDYQELEQVMDKAIMKMKRDREALTYEEASRHYHKLWESHQPTLVERLWFNLIHQIIPSSRETIRERMEEYQLYFPESTRFLAIYIHVQRWHKALTSREERNLEYALCNAAQEIIARNNRSSTVFVLKNSCLLAILPVQQGEKGQWYRDCEAYIAACNEYFYCNLACYMGDPVPPEKIAGMVQRLEQLDDNNVTAVNRVFTLSQTGIHDIPLPPAPIGEWVELMKQGDKDSLMAAIQQFLESFFHKHGYLHAKGLHSVYQDVVQMIFYTLQLRGHQANAVFSDSLLTEQPVHALRSLTALLEWMDYAIGIAINHMMSIHENRTVVEQAKQFIAENMGKQDLSRGDVARHVYLNPDYLTRVFKKETGMAVSDYLKQQRLEYAKHQLAYSHMTVSDIALSAGYSNLSYFSTLFKKEVRMNPLDYRKTMQTP